MRSKIAMAMVATLVTVPTVGTPLTARAASYSQNGYKVLTGSDAQEALEKYGAQGDGNYSINNQDCVKDVKNCVIDGQNYQIYTYGGGNCPSYVVPEQTILPAPETPAEPAPPEQPSGNQADTVTPEPVPAPAPAPADPTPAAPEPDKDATNNSFANQVVQLVNTERAKVGAPALVIDANISAAADVRAKETKTSFSHTRPDGSSFSSALRDAGVNYRGCGENIAWGQKSPEAVMTAWMNSDGHRANILNANYSRIGVGCYQNGGVNYWVQLFAY